ncbi:hypothetical protein TNCV_1678741 [Trichonephila clavipes]|nr:hypothetical protein TNCV_1678741 [Trichonephila clavipes]
MRGHKGGNFKGKDWLTMGLAGHDNDGEEDIEPQRGKRVEILSELSHDQIYCPIFIYDLPPLSVTPFTAGVNWLLCACHLTTRDLDDSSTREERW